VRFCGTIVYVDFCSSCRTWCQPHRGAFQWPRWQNFPPAIGGPFASRSASIRMHPFASLWDLVSISHTHSIPKGI
jgi:hypothetical protein